MIKSLRTALILLFCVVMPACCAPAHETKTEAITQKMVFSDKALIFDFSGTIANSVQNFVAAFNVVAPDYGLKTIPLHDLEKVRSMSVHDLLKKQGIWAYQLPFVANAVKKQAEKQMASLPAHAGVVELLKKLHIQGYKLFITSSNSLNVIQGFLKAHQLDTCFTDISAASAFDMLSKGHKLKKLMKKNNLNPAKTLYVGDEQRDIEATQSIGIPIVCVDWGFNTKSFLAQNKPTYLVSSAQELESVIKKHFGEKVVHESSNRQVIPAICLT